MVKPLDLDDFFKEQQERLDISDSDWEQYEERVYQDRKRKQTTSEGSISTSLTNDSSNSMEDKNTGPSRSALQDEMPSCKKRKVSPAAAKSPCLSDVIVISSLPPRAISTPDPEPESPAGQDISTTSRLRKSLSGHSATLRKLDPSTPIYVPMPPRSMSGNVTTPSSTPWQDSTTAGRQVTEASGSSPGMLVGKSKRESAPPKLLLKATEKGTRSSNELENKMYANRSARNATSLAKLEAEKPKNAQDDQEKLMTPLQYAAILQQKWHSRVSNTPPERLFLKNKVVFLVFEEQNKSSKDTRIKLDIIARSGGQVATSYDSNVVTHVIPGGSTITRKKTLRALGLRSLFEIPPDVHTVKWDWIVSGLSNGTPDSEIMHESFKQRIAHRYPKRQGHSDIKGKARASSLSITNEHSVIEDFTLIHDSRNDVESTSGTADARAASSHLQIRAGTSNPRLEDENPLLPFYAKAREEAAVVESDDDLARTNIPTLPKDSTTLKLKGFQCDAKGQDIQGLSLNWDIIEKLAELREMHRDAGTDDDKWRVIGYQKAIGSLKRHPTRIKSREEVLKLNGVSNKTADKIMEIIRTGELRRIKYAKTESLKVMRLFSGIYGVGSSTARKWFNQGLKSLDDVRQAVQDGTHKLSDAQEVRHKATSRIGLRFYDDINDRMPRAEAEEIFLKIKSVALSLDAKLSLDIMGSFRRGKETCGDIDILLTRNTDDGHTHAGILPCLCDILHKQGVLTEDLAFPDSWESLEATYRGLCRRDGESRRRRIDILCIPYECRGAARIYYTGDDIFNRSIRFKANKMNMSLNQRGLFQGVVRDPQDRTKKLCAGSLLCSDSERKIFELLGVPWQQPHERVPGG